MISVGSTAVPARHWPRPVKLVAWMLVLVLACACARPPEAVVLEGATMGTSWTVRLARLPESTSAASLRAGIESILEQINAEMSTYREDALVSRFNRADAGTVFELPGDFRHVLEASLHWAEASDGLFDPTVGPLVNLWGFGPDGRRTTPPDAAQLAAARERTGFQRIDYDPATGRLTQPGGLMLDFSAIAKGHAVDRIAGYLEELGADDLLVDIGGDMRASGSRPDGRPWQVAIERPDPATREIHSIIPARDVAIATSGTYRNYFEAGGWRWSHTIDPRSGEPVDTGIVSITVLHDTCMDADAAATLLGVMSAEAGLAFARRHQLAVLWIIDTPAGLAEQVSPRFKSRLAAMEQN